MADIVPESLPPFPKYKHYCVFFLQKWVDHLKHYSHFDESVIPVHNAKGYSTHFKYSELVPIYNKLKSHLKRDKELRLMHQRIKKVLFPMMWRRLTSTSAIQKWHTNHCEGRSLPLFMNIKIKIQTKKSKHLPLKRHQQPRTKKGQHHPLKTMVRLRFRILKRQRYPLKMTVQKRFPKKKRYHPLKTKVRLRFPIQKKQRYPLKMTVRKMIVSQILCSIIWNVKIITLLDGTIPNKEKERVTIIMSKTGCQRGRK